MFAFRVAFRTSQLFSLSEMTDPLGDSGVSMDLAAITNLFQQQLQASADRERRMEQMLQQTLSSMSQQASSSSSRSSATSSSTPSKPVSAEKPVLLMQ